MFPRLRAMFQTIVARHDTWTDKYGIRWVREDTSDIRYLRAARWAAPQRPSAHHYLQKYGDKFPWRDLWLQYGRVFPTPSLESVEHLEDTIGFMELKKCYVNALYTALILRGAADANAHEVHYAVGLAVSPDRVCPHAWVVVDGEVVDPTWGVAFLTSYFGVTFDPKWIERLFSEIGWTGILHDGMWDDFEAPLRQELNQRRSHEQHQ